jgi:hypothetical protein
MDKTGRKLGQTPEAFQREPLLRAFELTAGESFQDEVSMMWKALQIPPRIVAGTTLNTKLTVAKDLENAEGIMRFWQEPLEAGGEPGRVLVVGGSGDIGQALCGLLDDYEAPSRVEADVTSHAWNLSGFGAVAYCAGTVEPPCMPVNYDGFTRLARHSLEQGWTGNIVAVSSTAATYGRAGAADYSASKAALTSWIEASHEGFAEAGIRINAVAPAKVQGRLQGVLNPEADQSAMMPPSVVARRMVPYLNTSTHGHVVYLRYGLEEHDAV